MKAHSIIRLIVSISICELAGLLGSAFTISQITTWYATLAKPSFSPPDWIFGPVWAALYLMMGISLYLVWNKGLEKNKTAITAFGIQLALNILWTALFFWLHSPRLAFIEIIALWLAIMVTIVMFYKISKAAAGLMLPYILWVTFAAALNFSIAALNAGAASCTM